ncbi:MAG: pyridoxamine 5'-phosphate oxidase family protein [Firmicutes bacterium]|nr:pyridoxamine 5'-phosphate oxidase family protein [Bacillota bacterium]
MFRKLVISEALGNKEVPKEDCVRILKEQPRGVLAVLGDDEYPYCLPIDYWYSEEENRIYFHGAKGGHKVDAMRKHDKGCFCVCDEGYREEGDWALNISSVISFGRLKELDDYEKGMEVCRQLSYKFTDSTEYIESEIAESGPYTMVFYLEVEHMTGKLVNES